jgi:hypothetical protein
MITLLDYASTLQNVANRAKEFIGAARMVAIGPTDERALAAIVTNQQSLAELEADLTLLDTITAQMRTAIEDSTSKK